MSAFALVDEFWLLPGVAVNLTLFLNMLGALLLGLLVGYERSYHGRAAGMRTYGMVCMASCALTVLCVYPQHWLGDHSLSSVDPTRVIQGVVTGIGFLGAGLIMKDGMSISGLTTAASIWASSAIGVLVGVGFYGAAVLLSLISAGLMMWGAKLEARLPSRPALAIVLVFLAEDLFLMRPPGLWALAWKRLKTDNVGMVTGDASINPEAPVVCCTAEILANLTLRHGIDAPADDVGTPPAE